MKKIVGFFGGTFDPIHFGHINLALQLLEIHHLDSVLFCPAYCSPFKTAAPPNVNPGHRLAMVKLALEGIPKLQMTSYEIDRGDPSYTIDTLHVLKKESGEQVGFRLLLSEEAAACLEQWKDFQELIHLAPPLIGARLSSQMPKQLAHPLHSYYTRTKIFEISSIEIRERLKRGLYCGHLVPSKVLEYIQQYSLYSS